jgi:hypothetical protein
VMPLVIVAVTVAYVVHARLMPRLAAPNASEPATSASSAAGQALPTRQR